MADPVIGINVALNPPTDIRGTLAAVQRELDRVGLRVKVGVPRDIQSAIQAKATAGARAVSRLSTAQIDDLYKATAALKDYERRSREATNVSEDLGKQAAITFRRFAGYLLVTRTMYGLAGAIRSATGEALKLNREFVKIAQLTDTSARGVSSLKSTTLELSKAYGTSTLEIVKAAQSLAQAGKSMSDIDQILRAITPATLVAEFGDLAKNTENMQALLTQFNLKASQTGDVLDVLNVITKEYDVSVQELFDGLKRSGSAFGALSGAINSVDPAKNLQSLREFAAIFTTIISTSRESAESVGTALKTILPRLQRPTTINALREVGINILDEQGNVDKPFEAFRKISSAIKDMNVNGLQFSKILEEIGGSRQFNKVVALVTQFEKAERALAISQNAAGSIGKDVEIAQQDFLVQLSKVRAEFQALFVEIVNTGAFERLASSFITAANAAVKLADALVPLLPLLSIIGAGVALSGLKGFATKFRTNFGPSQLSGLNSGGPVGFARGGKVSAILTPGEIVVPPKEASRLGLSKLESANSSGSLGGSSLRSFAVVPGTGNTDTVRAGLDVGSYVIKKNSAQKILRSQLLARKNKGGAIGFVNGGSLSAEQRAIGLSFSREFRSLGGTAKQLDKTLKAIVGSTRNAGDAMGSLKNILDKLRSGEVSRTPTGRAKQSSLDKAILAEQQALGRAQKKRQADVQAAIERTAIQEERTQRRLEKAKLKNAVQFGPQRNPLLVLNNQEDITPIIANSDNLSNAQKRAQRRAGKKGQILSFNALSRINQAALLNNESPFFERDSQITRASGKTLPPGFFSTKTPNLSRFARSLGTPSLSGLNNLLNKPGVGIGAAVLAGSLAQSENKTAQGASTVLGGALAGGAVGSGIGGPFGTVIGAVIGGLAGLVSALDKYNKEIVVAAIDKQTKQLKEVKTIREFTSTFDSKLLGRSNETGAGEKALQAGTFFATAGTSSLFKKLDQSIGFGITSGARGRSGSIEFAQAATFDAFARLIGNSDDVNLNKLDKTVREREIGTERGNFQQSFELAIAKALEQIQSSPGSIGKTTESVKTLLQEDAGLLALFSENLKDVTDLDNPTIKMKLFAEVFNEKIGKVAQKASELADNLEKMGRSLLDWDGILDKSAKRLNDLQFLSSQEQRINERLFARGSNQNEFTGLAPLKNIFSDLTGRSQKEIIDSILQVQERSGTGGRSPIFDAALAAGFVQNDLQRSIFSATPTDDAETFIRSQFNGLPSEATDLIEKQLELFFQDEKGLGKKIGDLQKNPELLQQLKDTLNSGTLKQAQDTAAKGVDALNARTEALNEAFKKLSLEVVRVQTEALRINETRNNAADFQRSLRGDTSANIGLAQGREAFDLRQLTGQGDVSVANLTSQLRKLDQIETLSADEAAQQARLIKALELTASETRVLAEVEKKRAEVEKTKGEARSLIERLATGDNKAIGQFNRGLQDFGILSKGGAASLTPERRANALEAFRAVSGQFGIKDEDRERTISSLLGNFLTQRGLPQNIVNNAVNGGAEAKSLSVIAESAFERMAAAQQVLIDRQLAGLEVERAQLQNQNAMTPAIFAEIFQTSSNNLNTGLTKFNSLVEGGLSFETTIKPVTINLAISAPDLAGVADGLRPFMESLIMNTVQKNASQIADTLKNV